MSMLLSTFIVQLVDSIVGALTESTAAYAEQVSRSQAIFLAILGHDLRVRLQAVSMSTACWHVRWCTPVRAR